MGRHGRSGLFTATIGLGLVLAAGTPMAGQSPAPSPSQTPSAGLTALRLVSTAWPPFTNAAGQPRFALDLVEEALKRIGVTATTTLVDPVQYTAALLDGPYDGSAAAWKDADRQKVLLFSQPYLENRLILLGRHGADVSAQALAALKGKRIAIVQGYAYGDTTEQSGPAFVRSRTEEDSLRMLLDGNVDYALMDELVVQYLTSHYAEQARAQLAVGSTPLLTRPLYLAVRRSRPDAQSIIDRFNAQLRGMIADHTYHRLLHVEWIAADVDGDGAPEYIPASDSPGRIEPQVAYTLFTPEKPLARPLNPQGRFLVGGSVYDGWTNVPDRFKVEDPQKRPDPDRTTLGIFRFVW